MKLDANQVQDRFAQIVSKALKRDPSEVTLDARLDTDLGAESLDLIEITMECESQFNIWLPEKSVLDTAIEVFGPGVLEQDGRLTDVGLQLMRRRMPAEDAAAFHGDITFADLRAYFMTVRSWVRLIHGLIQYTPDSCPACGSAHLEAANGFRMKCKDCGHQLSLRSGEEINQDWVRNYYETEYLPAQSAAAGTPGGHPAA